MRESLIAPAISTRERRAAARGSLTSMNAAADPWKSRAPPGHSAQVVYSR
jgi:hypothetical protein